MLFTPAPDHFEQAGSRMYRLAERLFPICRSITGNGLRQSLNIIKESVSLTLHEVPSGTQVFDWQVPREWNIQDAYIANMRGERVIDFKNNSLHVLNYSTPIDTTLSREALSTHIFTLPDKPDWIPYRTSYFNDNWGFCLSQRQAASLTDNEYHVVIDSTLEPGALTYGEIHIPGQTDEHILLFAHSCHPSLANDNLSGMAVVTELATMLRASKPRYSYTCVFAPGTIGCITWLSRNQAILPRVKHGLVAAVLGDAGHLTYKKTRHENALIDRAVIHALQHRGKPFSTLAFSPYGYDERQFASPGINLPVGRLTRTPNGAYPEYHTSADNMTFIQPASLADSLAAYWDVISLLENNQRYINQFPYGEPQLGKRGLYRKTGGLVHAEHREMALLWILNQSDGTRDLLDIAERAQMPFAAIYAAAQELCEANVIRLA